MKGRGMKGRGMNRARAKLRRLMAALRIGSVRVVLSGDIVPNLDELERINSAIRRTMGAPGSCSPGPERGEDAKPGD